MIKHYGAGIVPARVRKPRGVLVAERWIAAASTASSRWPKLIPRSWSC